MHSREYGPYGPKPEEKLHYEPQYKIVKCRINGIRVTKMVDVRASLTDFLRNEFALTSVKKGCEVGECGACAVLIDGESFNSCIYLAIWAEGKDIWTTEGLTGFIVSATEIISRGKYYTIDELRKELANHMCRCTGYENILIAVQKANNIENGFEEIEEHVVNQIKEEDKKDYM